MCAWTRLTWSGTGPPSATAANRPQSETRRWLPRWRLMGWRFDESAPCHRRCGCIDGRGLRRRPRAASAQPHDRISVGAAHRAASVRAAAGRCHAQRRYPGYSGSPEHRGPRHRPAPCCRRADGGQGTSDTRASRRSPSPCSGPIAPKLACRSRLPEYRATPQGRRSGHLVLPYHRQPSQVQLPRSPSPHQARHERMTGMVSPHGDTFRSGMIVPCLHA
jgi:hypothetical protein